MTLLLYYELTALAICIRLGPRYFIRERRGAHKTLPLPEELQLMVAERGSYSWC